MIFGTKMSILILFALLNNASFNSIPNIYFIDESILYWER